jgi:hypothetical protein
LKEEITMRNGMRNMITWMGMAGWCWLGGGEARAAGDSLEERVSKLEKLMQKDGGFRTKGMDWFSLSGELEWEYKDAEADPAQPTGANSHARFDLDKFVLSPFITITDDMSMTGEIVFTETTGAIDEWEFACRNLPLDMYFRTGYFERFTKEKGFSTLYSYETESIPMHQRSWNENDQKQVEIGGRYEFKDVAFLDSIGWVAMYGSGQELSTTSPGENGGYALTADGDDSDDADKNKNEHGFGLTAKFKPVEDYVFEVTSWTFEANLNQDEQATVRALPGYTALDANASANGVSAVDDQQQRSGWRTSHQWKDFLVTYEMAEGSDGELDRKGAFVQASYQFKFDPLWKDRYFNSVTPVVRFDSYEVEDLPRLYSNTQTWDYDMEVYALLLGITHKTLLKVEYYAIGDKTGGTGALTSPEDPDNDEVLVQLEVKF